MGTTKELARAFEELLTSAGRVFAENIAFVIDSFRQDHGGIKLDIKLDGKEIGQKIKVGKINTGPIGGYYAGGVVPAPQFLEEWPTASWEGEPNKNHLDLIDRLEKRRQEERNMRELEKSALAIAQTFGRIGVDMEELEGLKFHPNDEMANLKELQKAEGIIKGLRERSKKKAESNRRMSHKHNHMLQEIAEYKRDQELLLEQIKQLKPQDESAYSQRFEDYEQTIRDLESRVAERDAHIKEVKAEAERWYSEAERLADEVEKGNEYRQGLKDSIENLHGEIRDEKERRNVEEQLAQALDAELNRYFKIVDFMLKHNGF